MIPNELWEILASELGAKYWRSKPLVKNIHAISENFTSKRDQFARDYLSKEDELKAYVAYFLPLNFLKVQTLLKAHEPAWLSSKLLTSNPVRILDFGCGPGTATLAFLHAISEYSLLSHHESSIEIHLLEKQKSALSMAERLVARFAKAVGLKIKIIKHLKLDEVDKNISFDFVIAANVFNEMETPDKEREPALKIFDHVSGFFLILEPSHRVPSQKLIRMRARLINEFKSGIEIIGPCLHSGVCPLYRHEKNWCHFSQRSSDPHLKTLNTEIFNDERGFLKFSYLFLKRKDEGSPLKQAPANHFRAIGDLHLVSNPEKASAVDLCVPKEKRMLKLPREDFAKLSGKLYRGAVVELKLGLDETDGIKRIFSFNEYDKNL